MNSRVTLGPCFPECGKGSQFSGSKDRKHLVSHVSHLKFSGFPHARLILGPFCNGFEPIDYDKGSNQLYSLSELIGLQQCSKLWISIRILENYVSGITDTQMSFSSSNWQQANSRIYSTQFLQKFSVEQFSVEILLRTHLSMFKALLKRLCLVPLIFLLIDGLNTLVWLKNANHLIQEIVDL